MKKQLLIWIEWRPDEQLCSGGRFIPTEVEQSPQRVWTLFLDQDKSKPPALPIIPVHHKNAFIEDKMHDWRWDKGIFHYYSRVVDCSCWILLEY